MEYYTWTNDNNENGLTNNRHLLLKTQDAFHSAINARCTMHKFISKSVCADVLLITEITQPKKKCERRNCVFILSRNACTHTSSWKYEFCTWFINFCVKFSYCGGKRNCWLFQMFECGCFCDGPKWNKCVRDGQHMEHLYSETKFLSNTLEASS